MSWLGRGAAWDADEAATLRFAARFATALDRSFPIDDATIDRVRSRALEAFIEAAPTEAAPPVATPRFGRQVRRGLTVALAATVAAFTFGTVAVQAQPGGPFYSLKLAIETANLPSVEAPAGWDARIGRLQRRIDESVAARRSGDAGAVTSGLGEYRAELAALNSELIDPVRRSGLTAVVSQDLAIVLDLETAYPSELVRLLVEDMQALVGSTDRSDGHAGPSDRPTDDRRAYDAITNSRGGSGDRHAGNAMRGQHHEDAMGNPHTAGENGKPSDGRSTGNPHAAGENGKPDTGRGSPSNPHDEGSTGNPHDGGSGANPDADGKRSPSRPPRGSGPH